MGRVIVFLLLVSFIGAIYLNGGFHDLFGTWLAALLAILKHIFTVAFDFAWGLVMLIINALRELFGF